MGGECHFPSSSAPSVSHRAKINFYLNARKVAARAFRLWLQLRYRAQEFCMTYVPGAPIASPDDSQGSGEPVPCRERQLRHGEYWVTVVVSGIAADPAR